MGNWNFQVNSKYYVDDALSRIESGSSGLAAPGRNPQWSGQELDLGQGPAISWILANYACSWRMQKGNGELCLPVPGLFKAAIMPWARPQLEADKVALCVPVPRLVRSLNMLWAKAPA